MVFIGKNVLENLTVSMYEDSKTVYREYIQNAADSIDQALEEGILTKKDALIEIFIEPEKRRVTIRDNGYGVRQEDFKTRLFSIADSEKIKGKDKGFRGIGRLGGLGYCDTLKFSTSVKGESVESIMQCDAKTLNKAYNDQNDKRGTIEIFDSITTFDERKADLDSHYFEVVMDGIFATADELLDVETIRHYLESVAPVPYQSYFLPYTKIKKFAAENGFTIDEYKIILDKEQIFKPYETKIYAGNDDGNRCNHCDTIQDVAFRIFRNEQNVIMAWGWFGLSCIPGTIHEANRMRGIRMRKENIQIGNETYLQDYFKSSRGYEYFVGEIFAIDKGLNPNARRDDFTHSNEFKYFENKKLRPWCQGEMAQIPRKASNFRGDYDKLSDALKKAKEVIGEFQKEKSQIGDTNSQVWQRFLTIQAKISKLEADINKKKDKASGSDNEGLMKIYSYNEAKFIKSEKFSSLLKEYKDFEAKFSKPEEPEPIDEVTNNKSDNTATTQPQKPKNAQTLSDSDGENRSGGDNQTSGQQKNRKKTTVGPKTHGLMEGETSAWEKSGKQNLEKKRTTVEKSASETQKVGDGMIYMKVDDVVDCVSKALSKKFPPEMANSLLAIFTEVLADVSKSAAR